MPTSEDRSVLGRAEWEPDATWRYGTAADAVADVFVLSVEYRRHPGRPDDAMTDVATALRSAPPQFDGAVVAGHSAGGHLALWLAANLPVDCLALAPVVDLVAADDLALGAGAVGDFLGGPARGRPDLDPSRLPAPAGRVTVVHGSTDSLVPIGLSQTYAEAHEGAVRLVPIPSCGHFELIDPQSPAWPTVAAELDRLDGESARDSWPAGIE